VTTTSAEQASAAATSDTRSSPPGRGATVAIWTCVACAAGLDILTTHAGLAAGLGEANPLARSVFTAVGFGPGALALKTVVIAIGLVVWAWLPDTVANRVPELLAGLWSLVSVVNAIGVMLA
jgi:hypothetical protein